MSIHRLTDIEYLKKLKTQRDFLGSEIREYEEGKKDFALKIAATLRTIFHKTKHSMPILPDLAERNGCQVFFKGRYQDRIDPYLVLYIGFTVGMKKPLFDAPFLVNKPFKEYWDEVVYVEGRARYTRKQLVLYAANKLGGVHVDPEIPAELLHLVDGSVKLISKKYGEETIINQVVYEMALQVMNLLNQLIPVLEGKIGAKQ